jgi:hypothetical protein
MKSASIFTTHHGKTWRKNISRYVAEEYFLSLKG